MTFFLPIQKDASLASRKAKSVFSMVRRIRSCCRCQRRFTATSGESTCCKCCRVRQQLAAVLPSHSPLSSEVNRKNDDNILVEESEDEFDTQEPPLRKRPKMATENNAALTNASHKLPATSNDESDSSDSDDDVPLSTLFRKKSSATTSDPIVLKDPLDEKYHVNATDSNNTVKTPAGAPSDPIVLDDSIDEDQMSFIDKKAITEFPSHALSDDACFICGSNLKNLSTGLKGRLNHLKRCSKKYGVTARVVKLNDDSELFVSNEDDNTDTNDGTDTDSDWHAGAATDLALANHDGVMYKENAMHRKQPAAKAATKQTTMGKFFQMPVRSLNNVLLAGARRAAKSTEILTAKQGSGRDNASKGGKQKRMDYSKFACPMYKKIPGTDFICDGFIYAKNSLTSNYFLTHFHADHYGGITKQWNAGIIYCSLETANLVHQKLGVDRKYLHPLGLMTPTIIESKGRPVTVTLMDANHCPGAVMFLFEVGKRRILHVGDFRWNRQLMTQYAPLRAFSTLQYRLDDLFLDTTYCDAKYTLPTQAEAIRATVQVAEKEWNQSRALGRKTLFLFGAYTIGKERIYLSVAERLNCKVYVDKARYKILSVLNWPRERMALLTTNKEESLLWVVPLGHINFKKLPEYLCGSDKVFSKKKYDRVVGFRPTGWSMSSKSSGIVNSQSRGSFTVHGVPYSEHSSFDELVDCLDCLKPKRIIPTVSASKSQEQVDLLLRHLKQKQGR